MTVSFFINEKEKKGLRDFQRSDILKGCGLLHMEGLCGSLWKGFELGLGCPIQGYGSKVIKT